MIEFLTIILIFSIALVVYNYLLYPSILSFFARDKSLKGACYLLEELPKIALVFAAYNEEKVIVNKLQNIDQLDYPSTLLDVHVGLDHPDDQTAALIKQNIPSNFSFNVHHFKERSGKANVLNKMFNYSLQLTDYDIVVMMDANIISKENCLFELVKYFKNPKVGLVGAVIENTIIAGTEIAEQEQFYMAKESEIKVNEGILFGATIGAFGACYAIRAKHIISIPSNFLMEDFYLSLNVLKEDALCLTNPAAVVYEDLNGSMREEFNRKRRISTGNFQNLKAYIHLVWTKNWRIGLPFVSHKILRWFSPFLILLSIITCVSLILLDGGNAFIRCAFILMLINLIAPALDIVLKRVNINVNLLRIHRYFLCMNIAVFLGFIDWLKGVKTNIWKPTERL
ncbi:glycosyltransferase [Chitinophagales bacterium]|nr:glycosyltransferase [Chitinophagales bacterium]